MIEVEQRDHISILHMSHGKANALDTEFCQALTARLEAYRHSATQALVLTGHGQIFSAGVDILRVLDGGPRYLTAFLPAFALTKRQVREPVMRRVREDGAQFDVKVQELREAPTTLTAIRAYVTRTFNQSP